MKIQIVCDDNLLAKVIILGKRNSKTLGMFPEGAFRDHARKKLIFAAVEDDQLLGYILFRLTQSKRIICITHLCVEPDHRNKGIAKELLNTVKAAYSGMFKGISLNCRKDYVEASKFWEKYGFKAMQTNRSRSKSEKYLVKWYYDFGNIDLFSSIDKTDDKINALLDCNIIVKLRDEEDPDSYEATALAADWLEEEVEYFFAPEVFNEINRDLDLERANKTRRFLDGFKPARFIPDERDKVFRQLNEILPGNSINDISDKKQLSECIVSGIEYFITLDYNLLEKNDDIYEQYSVRIIRPSDFILFIDHSIKGRDYNSYRVAGAQFEQSNIRQEEIDILVEDRWLVKGEKKHELRKVLTTVISDIKYSIFRVIRTNKGDYIGYFATTLDKDSLIVKALRISWNNSSVILFQQIIRDIILLAVEKEKKLIIIDETGLTPEYTKILDSFGFEQRENSWYKIVLTGVSESVQIIESNPVISNLWDRNTLLKSLNDLTGENLRYFKFQLEKKLWPIKISDLDLPVYIIPVRPHWASQLFDHYSANYSLFGAKAELTWSRENVYYRSIKPVSEIAPARILWYVSSETKIVTGRGKGILATSYLDEVHIGPAKSLYSKFKNYGIYDWKNIFEMTKQEAYMDIKALKFSDTEVFKTPVSLNQVSRILTKFGRPENSFASPVEVSMDIFKEIYRIGKH